MTAYCAYFILKYKKIHIVTFLESQRITPPTSMTLLRWITQSLNDSLSSCNSISNFRGTNFNAVRRVTWVSAILSTTITLIYFNSNIFDGLCLYRNSVIYMMVNYWLLDLLPTTFYTPITVQGNYEKIVKIIIILLNT